MSTKTKTQVKKETVKMSPKAVNKARNRQARKESKQEIGSTDGVTYLKEGITGKQRRAALLDSNKAIKIERATYKRAIDDIFAYGTAFINQVDMSKTQLKKALTPRAIKNQFTNYQIELAINSIEHEKKGYINYSPYFMMNAIEKALKAEDVNPLAVEFFDALESEDEKLFKKVVAKVRKVRAKYRAEQEKKQATEA